jgi:hypothetical protein
LDSDPAEETSGPDAPTHTLSGNGGRAGTNASLFNDTDAEILWPAIAATENAFEPGESFDLKPFSPLDPKQLPKE